MGLHPSFFEPYPDHHHGEDGVCPLSSCHDNHCIRAAHAPLQCVIPLDKPHVHCDSLRHHDNYEAYVRSMRDWSPSENSMQQISPSPMQTACPSPAPPTPGQDTPVDTDYLMTGSDLSPEPEYGSAAAVEPAWSPRIRVLALPDPGPPDLVF